MFTYYPTAFGSVVVFTTLKSILVIVLNVTVRHITFGTSALMAFASWLMTVIVIIVAWSFWRHPCRNVCSDS